MIVLYKLTWDSVEPKISGIKINTPIVFNADVSCSGILRATKRFYQCDAS